MSFACICSNEDCYERKSLDSTIHSNKIQISEIATETTLEDLRIRFSVYGSIKDCYLDPITNKHAYIIFDETCSAIKAAAARIYLHGQKLEVCEEETELNIDPERIKFRRVCKHWLTMTDNSLLTMRDLDLSIRGLRNFEHSDHEQQFRQLLEELDQRGLLREKSESFYNSYPSTIIAALYMHLFALDCENLTKLIIKCSTYDEDILSSILMVNKKLRHIEILFNPYITGKSLNHLSEKIHTFIVQKCEKLEYNHLCAALRRFKNLKYLKLFEQNVCNVINILNEYCPKLEVLVLNFCTYYDADQVPVSPFDINLLPPITSLTELTDLEIVTPAYITETFLVNLSRNCQKLRRLKLDLYDNTSISETGINAIDALTKLEELDLTCTGIDSANLHGLHKISLEGCSNIQEEQVLSVIRNSPELKYLNLCGCNNITRNIVSFLSKAITISANRCNNLILELITGDREYEICHVIYNGKIY